MYTATIDCMDLKQISESGQCFRMKCIGDKTYAVTAFGSYTEITQQGREFTFSCSEDEFQRIWAPYFDLSTDYGAIMSLVDPSDAYLTAAVQNGCGIRILNQDLWEMIITFLISQNNNITRITRSVEALCAQLGEPCAAKQGIRYNSFPTAASIAAAGLEGLGSLGLGYRDKYILKTAEHAVEGSFDLSALQSMPYGKAHAYLMEQYGIGKKVADCVCLFGLHHVNAFPIDTHIKKILDVHYPDGFPYERYAGVLGIVQQYLFYYDLFPSRAALHLSANCASLSCGQ